MNRKKLIIITLIVITSLLAISLVFLTVSNKGHNLIERVSQIRKAQTESDMKEKLQSAITALQTEKQGKVTLDDITQEWINKKITEYECLLTTDPSISGKKVILQKSEVISKFLLDENINISEIEKSPSGIELSYEALNRTDENIQGLVIVENYEDNLKSINFVGKNNNIQAFKNKKVAIDYEIPLGEEQKIELIAEDGTVQEKNLIIEDYWYTITKKLADGISLNNVAIKAAYNKPYTATLIAEDCIIDSVTVTMAGQTIPINENNTINIPKVTGNIEIVAKNNYIIKNGKLQNTNYHHAGNPADASISLVQKQGYVELTTKSGESFGTGISWKIDTSATYKKLKCTLTCPSKSSGVSNGTTSTIYIGKEQARQIYWKSWSRKDIDGSYGSYNLGQINSGGTFTEPYTINTPISENPKTFHIVWQITGRSGNRTYRIYELKLE